MMYETLRDMALFVEIARTLSFTRAAAVLGVPISSVSRRFAQFEKSLGVQLINRTSRNLQLTEIGRQYYMECERIVAEAGLAHESLKRRRDELEGPVRLSMTPDFGANHFAPLLAEFAQTHPHLSFELDLTPHFVDLVANGIDIAIRFGHPDDSRLTMKTLGAVQHGLYATPSYLGQHGVPEEPEDLIRHAGIVLRSMNRGLPMVTCDGRSASIELKQRFLANHVSMLRSLALFDMGVALVPELVVREDVRMGALVRLLPKWSFPAVPVIALTPTRLMPARVRLFYEFISERCRGIL